MNGNDLVVQRYSYDNGIAFTIFYLKTSDFALWTKLILSHIVFCAESEGFEPPVQLPVHLISSQARSTTPAAFLFVERTKLYIFSKKFPFSYFIFLFDEIVFIKGPMKTKRIETV